jgi:ABC-type transporter Mla MlaB component
MVMQVRSTDGPAAVKLSPLGKVAGSSLGELRRQIKKARRHHKEVAIDLSEVTLVDPGGVAFLVEQSADDIRLINCPEYLEPWVDRARRSVGRD